jgi:aryl-alcohol dehydrogenase-like predicted oxidoreductase
METRKLATGLTVSALGLGVGCMGMSEFHGASDAAAGRG